MIHMISAGRGVARCGYVGGEEMFTNRWGKVTCIDCFRDKMSVLRRKWAR